MAMLLSELYGKQIITNTGKMLGSVEDLILDFESGSVASLLLVKMDDLVRSPSSASALNKNSVRYSRVKNVSETVIVSATDSKR